MQTNTEIGNALTDGSLVGAMGIIGFLEDVVTDMRALSIMILVLVVGGMVIWKLTSSRGNGAGALGTVVLGAVLVGLLMVLPGLAQDTASEATERGISGSGDAFNDLFNNGSSSDDE